MDKVKMVLAEGTTFAHGGGGGSWRGPLNIEEGDYLQSISLGIGKEGEDSKRVTCIKCTSKNGRTLQGGKGDRDEYLIEAPDGWQISGLHGRYGEEGDRLDA